jgi:dTDP-4-dehydrorhamnose 3,5-epimerase
MEVCDGGLPGLLLVKPRVFGDDRGFFVETYHAKRYGECGIACTFVQFNQSRSRHHVLRGLHYQLAHPQAKLVMVPRGAVFDVAVDIRKGSPTFGRWKGFVLSDENKHQVFLPEGFAHGFSVLSEVADFLYQCSDYYAPRDERGILWNDPDLAIEWPNGELIVSPKDAVLPRLRDVGDKDLPRYAGRQS